MGRINFATYQSLFGAVYLGLATNVLLAVGNLPLLALLLTTDPAASWPWLAAVVPLSAPAVVAAFAAFRAHASGSPDVIRDFIAGYRRAWWRSLALAALATLVLVVLLIDVRYFSDSPIGVVVIPLLGVLLLLAVSMCVLGFTALAEVPQARLRDVLWASLYFGLRRWYLTAGSLVVLAAFVWFFTTMPALALGLAAAPAFYLAWANSRHTLLPVLDVADIEVAA